MMNKQKPRQRVSAACQGCRIRRTKCDGDATQCSACRLRNQDCEYSQAAHNRKPPSKNYVRALEARIQSLEQELAAARESRNADPQPNAETSHSGSSGTSMARASDLDVDVITDTLGSFNIGDGGTICYLGSRSNLNLLRCGMPRRASSSQETQHRAHNYRDAQEPSILDGVSEELQTHLLDLFWTWQNSWQRVVARDPFLHDLHANPSFPMSRFSSPSLICAIYALASRYSDVPELRADPNDPATAGDAFTAEAKRMLIHECEAPTISTVQATAILSMREAAADKEASGWMYCGMATRMAFSLGLHLDCSRCVTDGEMTAEEAEVRSVTWWGCYVLDKLWTVGLGRPSMIQNRDITATLPSTNCSEENLPCPSSCAADPTTPTSRSLDIVSCSIYLCKLFTASAELLDSIYAPSGKTENKAAIVSDGNLRLVAFYNSLPSSLKLTRSPQDSSPPNVYLLHLQYHTTMILLHRPFLTSFRAANGKLGGLRDGSIHATMCRNSADWIAAIFRWYKGHYGLRKIPVSAVHCAFTAAVIFLAAATAEDLEVRGKATQALKCLCQALEEMQTAWNWSTRALLAVRSIARVWKVELPRFRSTRPRNTGLPVSANCSGGMPAADLEAPFTEELLEEEVPVDLLFEPFVDFNQDAQFPTWDSLALFPFDDTGEHQDIWQGLF